MGMNIFPGLLGGSRAMANQATILEAERMKKEAEARAFARQQQTSSQDFERRKALEILLAQLRQEGEVAGEGRDAEAALRAALGQAQASGISTPGSVGNIQPGSQDAAAFIESIRQATGIKEKARLEREAAQSPDYRQALEDRELKKRQAEASISRDLGAAENYRANAQPDLPEAPDPVQKWVLDKNDNWVFLSSATPGPSGVQGKRSPTQEERKTAATVQDRELLEVAARKGGTTSEELMKRYQTSFSSRNLSIREYLILNNLVSNEEIQRITGGAAVGGGDPQGDPLVTAVTGLSDQMQRLEAMRDELLGESSGVE